ncbi:MAG: ribosomal protein S18-alanine N-acetyltransferase [Aromatoleum sp.]|uniref:ribosomal protein S18-alanine N-acetyltransferase n=1 Tax=Aromatoleum sp. TaxID=2307007 RepID=UPI00289391F7|nr:ribosomal protein S18-alanine N-acetyltransferase [Aromatoleum sp.]MDT3671071.1 ribosomal protein S18-alanine N-acetyltransferase [Aromatoleum sp.]
MAGSAVLTPMTELDLDWVVENEAELHAFPWTRGNFVDSLVAGYGAWILRDTAQPLAYAVMLTVVDEAHLLNISVARPAQRAGIGGRLLRQLFDEARERGASQFFLEVRPSNEAAIALYDRHGFESIGRRRGYYPARDGGREDAIVMRREL